MRTVIGFAGPARCGKGTAAEHLIANHKFHLIKFAGPLKDMLRAMGFDEAEIEGGKKELPSPKLTHANFKNLGDSLGDAFKAIGVDLNEFDDDDPIPLLSNRTLAYAAISFAGIVAQVVARGEKAGGGSPRSLMQMIGTDWGRDMIASDLWIQLWNHRVSQVPPEFGVVVDDVRFPNEAAAVKAMGGTVARIIANRPGVGIAGGHSSETQLFPHDIQIDNSSSIATFRVCLDGLVSGETTQKKVADMAPTPS